MDSGETLLHLKNLTKTYRRSHLGKVTKTVGVENFELEVKRGEIFGVIGLNGAGKTTTLKLILGLLFPTSGEIFLFGEKMPSQKALQKVGFLPEVPYFPPHFTVAELLRYYGELSGLAPEIITQRSASILDLVRMSGRKEKRIRECSKGMLQRLSLAQTLIHDPEFLILDEPITGLDPLGLTEMREMIVRLNHEGKTILFSSHFISEVEKIAHRTAILSGGKLVRVIDSSVWKGKNGELEKIFVKEVRKLGAQGLE